jgi:hypothetical protein
MKQLAWRVLVLRIVLALAALAMAVLTGCGWRSVIGFGLLQFSVMVADYAHTQGSRRATGVSLSTALLLSVWVLYTLVTGDEKVFGLYLAITAWLLSAAIAPFSSCPFRAMPRSWRVLAGAWLCFGTGVALGMGYMYSATLFMIGLAGLFATILIALWWFKMPRISVQLSIAALLVIAGLPVVNHFVRPRTIIREPVNDFAKYYSYEAARKDPEVYMAWMYYAMTKWMEFERAAVERKAAGDLPFRLRPNTRTRLFNSEVSVNSLGFRGPEFFPHRTNAFRIITLGESTTFGYTLTADQHPWPELLQAKIRNRLNLQRPVEVINAGFPGRNLPQNIYRLKHELLEFAPDMIISYHGYNGFFMLSSAVPAPSGPPPPAYFPRPVKLLADVEYHLKLSFYRRSRTGKSGSHHIDFSKPMETPYADAYRELIQVAQTNHIQLVLANYSMAVNSESDPDLIQFYRGGFPAIYFQIKANRAHSTIVEKLAAEYPNICFVDTHPRLDGEHDKFADLMHFNVQGEEQIAETFFTGIRTILERELGVTAAAK